MPDDRPPAEPTDEEVLTLAADELDWLGLLYDRHRVAAYSLALRITADPGLAEDAVQEAFLDVWRGSGGYAPERGSVKAWLLAIVRHRSIDSIRRRRPVDDLPAADDPAPATLTMPDIWPEVASRLDRGAILAALATLNPDQRDAIELAYFGGLTQTEIAVTRGVPLGTVKGRLRLGLVGLRRALEAAGTGRSERNGGAAARHDNAESRLDGASEQSRPGPTPLRGGGAT